MGVPGLLGLLRRYCAEKHVQPVDLAKLGASSPQAFVLAVDGYNLLFYLLSRCADTSDGKRNSRSTAIHSVQTRET
jgi:hypothetical protein